MSKLIDYLKYNFQFLQNTNSDIHEYEFKNYGNNYLWKIETNLKNSYVNFENLTAKLKINMYYPNNNVLTYINLKNKHFTESIYEMENISYYKFAQSNINNLKFYFSGELNKIIQFLKIKYYFTLKTHIIDSFHVTLPSNASFDV